MTAPTRPAGDGARTSDAVLLTLIAAAMRWLLPAHLGIDHFDEGAYAMTAGAVIAERWSDAYPLQHFLSPPLFFGLGSIATVVAGGVERGLFLVSMAAGVATAPLIYLAGCRWWGRTTGGAAALVVALSDFHVLYSRAGLTDVLFTALLVLAVALFAEAEHRESLPVAALAGLATGLAWNTKYHGWLAVVIAAVAVLPKCLRAPSQIVGAISRLAVGGVVAAGMYVPWAIYIQNQSGGYAALAAEHARFLRPLRAVQSLVTQVAFQRYLEGWPARVTPLVMCGWIAWTQPAQRQTRTLAIGVLLTLGAIALGSTVALGALAAIGLVTMLRAYRDRGTRQWYSLAFFVVFTGLTPLYRPYARLMLPWLVAAAVMAPIGIEWLLGLSWTPARRNQALGVGAALIAVVLAVGVPPAAVPWRSRSTLRDAAAEMSRLVPDDAPIVVIGEPATVFYLRSAGRRAWHIDRAADAARYVAGSEYYIAGGIYSRRLRGRGAFPEWLSAHPEVVPVGVVSVTDMSDVRLLDDFGPPGAYRFRRDPRGDYDFRVFRVPAAAH